MATREDNIKKIDAELEQLSDEQLEEIAGGTFTENKYKEVTYNQAGIKTDYSFCARDKFFAKAATACAARPRDTQQAEAALQRRQQVNQQNRATRAVGMTVSQRAAQRIVLVDASGMCPFKQHVDDRERFIELNRRQVVVSQTVPRQKFVGNGLRASRALQGINAARCNVDNLRGKCYKELGNEEKAKADFDKARVCW